MNPSLECNIRSKPDLSLTRLMVPFIIICPCILVIMIITQLFVGSYCLFVALVVTFALLLRSGGNVTTQTIYFLIYILINLYLITLLCNYTVDSTIC